MIPVDTLDRSTPDPTAHLHALADVLAGVLDGLPADVPEPADPALIIRMASPACYVCDGAWHVIHTVPVADLPPSAADAIAAFVAAAVTRLPDDIQRDATTALSRRVAEPAVTFRASTGTATLVLVPPGGPAIELARMQAQITIH
jgi:hypothetical protein